MGLFFEEFELGQTWESPGRTVTETDIVLFAGLSGDNNPLHTDEEFARTTAFGARIAHGALGLAIATGLGARGGHLDGTALAFLGVAWEFKQPIRIGDTVRLRWVVKNKRETSKGDCGILERAAQLLNQRGETVQEGLLTVMVKRRSVR
jgi:acyl dehydratase